MIVVWLVLAPWRAARIAAGCGFLSLHPVASKVRFKGEMSDWVHLLAQLCPPGQPGLVPDLLVLQTLESDDYSD